AILRDVAAAHDFRYVALRYFNVAGADPEGRAGQATPEATHLIKVACEAAIGTRGHISVFGADYDTPDGTGVRDYIHVSDLADAHVAALAYLANGGDSATVNCGYGSGFSVREVIAAVEAAAGARLDVRDGPRRAGDPPALIADAARLRALFDWRPQHADLAKIAETALAWERAMADRTD
ncbi:MAG: NAD-dependent epimerase/dehydratase family protein, partial [Alphaproteobacteria bacterium]